MRPHEGSPLAEYMRRSDEARRRQRQQYRIAQNWVRFIRFEMARNTDAYDLFELSDLT